MIIDHIENMGTYDGVHKDLPKVLETLANWDIPAMESGRYPVEGSDAYIMVQRYTSRDLAVSKWESHRKYIDVQYVVQGEERMGYQHISNLKVSQQYDDASDAALYTGQGVLIPAPQGTVALFFPQDGHMPGVAVDEGVPMLKIVAKLPV